MKISKIEFENFRNFKERGHIDCSTDGKVTIIYGLNGDGKTTLHQLFQWIFYGDVHFNKTTDSKLYNLTFEKSVDYGEDFKVWGSVDFIHDGEEYKLSRELTYKKGLNSSKIVKEDLSLIKKDENNNWNIIDDPKLVVDDIIPLGLSEYFFFDGESMLAELRVKGMESANKLKRALYSIFDLNIYEDAKMHIGTVDLKTTVLGKLFLSKSSQNRRAASVAKLNIDNAQDKISYLQKELDELEHEKTEKEEFKRVASERIGESQSGKYYEERRKDLKKKVEQELFEAERVKGEFGELISKSVPKLFANRAMKSGNYRIDIERERNKLIPGLNRELICALLKNSKCICGRDLCDDQYDHINEFLTLLPPDSYANSFDVLTRGLDEFKEEFDEDELSLLITKEADRLEAAELCDKEIKQLDENKKQADSGIEQLILDRQKAEEDVKSLESMIKEKSADLSLYKKYLKAEMKIFEKETAAGEQNELINRKIEIMEAVRAEFDRILNEKSKEYSSKLENEIQSLLNVMLTSKRTVSVSNDFFVRVYDSTDDESKSEGQFAVVSFAYIGGIFKLLKTESSLEGKEYPLVLDGPFSKLDSIQRQNVIDVLPEYAPQIIIFSKDNLQPYFSDEKIGNVWTLQSNEEKNIASVKEGFLW